MGVLVISSCTNSLGGLNNRNLYFTFLEAGKSKVMVLVNLVPGKISLLGFQMLAFSLCMVAWW